MSLIPARQNFRIYPGATFYEVITLMVDGVVQDLSDFSAKLIVKSEPEKEVLLELTNGKGISLGGEEGTIELYISEEDTQSFAWDDGVYELFLDSGPRTDVLLRGGLRVISF